MKDLRTTQRWVADIVMAGESVNDAAAQTGTPIDDMIEPSATMSPAQRIDVYHGMYRDRLIDILGNDYPALRCALGQDRFYEVAEQYLLAHPSQSFDLNMLGKALPAYLQNGDPFIAELARFERLLEELFHEPIADRLDPEALSKLSPDDWLTATLIPAPTLRLMQTTYPVSAFCHAAEADETPSIPSPAKTPTAICRDRYAVEHHVLDADAYDLLTELTTGVPLGTALETHAAHAENIGPWFHAWSAAGFFAGITI